MKITKQQGLDFLILALRWYLAYYMISYGWSKLTGEQFGVYNPTILEKPLKEVETFYLAWHLFSSSVLFDITVGLSQIIGGLLVIINRTTLIGALLLLPILGQIFLIDVAFTTDMFGAALPTRLTGMIVSDFLILFYYKDKIMVAWHTLTNDVNTHFKYKWWLYLLLPIIGLGMDFIWAVITFPIRWLIDLFLR